MNNTNHPLKPKKGDIEACDRYAQYMAKMSNDSSATLKRIWIQFIATSFLLGGKS